MNNEEKRTAPLPDEQLTSVSGGFTLLDDGRIRFETGDSFDLFVGNSHYRYRFGSPYTAESLTEHITLKYYLIAGENNVVSTGTVETTVSTLFGKPHARYAEDGITEIV